ncbi:protein kinase domain-containing protein [Mucisphaera sp.]|uniref:protein kinase domain-containing protein n=1 Tax=Mucisphaera sp. TaxID=2913024 RepID=UPI003D0FA98C
MAESKRANIDSMVGRLVVERGLATSSEVQRCLEKQRAANDGSDPRHASLAHFLVAEGIVTRKQVERLIPEIEASKGDQQIPGYELMGRLGAGAMATVHKARQLSLDRLVAIKVLPRKHTNNPQFVERFYAEGRAAAKLNHPNIVQAIDVGKAGEYHYFVMEYVEGHTVYDELSEKGHLSEEDALEIAIPVAKALEHAHEAGFIHRDVKPKNIMLTNDGKVKLADMGLARAISDREAAEAEAGKAYGTPYYISPEQIRGERNVDFRADIYGLGATLYHAVTGQVPFDGPNPSAVMHQHLKAELVPPDHLNPRISTGLGEIIEVCMAKDRNKRYESTQDLLEDLTAVSKGEAPVHARKLFDMSSLSVLAGDTVEDSPLVELKDASGNNINAILILAAVGWAVAGGLLLALLISQA